MASSVTPYPNSFTDNTPKSVAYDVVFENADTAYTLTHNLVWTPEDANIIPISVSGNTAAAAATFATGLHIVSMDATTVVLGKSVGADIHFRLVLRSR